MVGFLFVLIELFYVTAEALEAKIEVGIFEGTDFIAFLASQNAFRLDVVAN